jgi:hypothetical protein
MNWSNPICVQPRLTDERLPLTTITLYGLAQILIGDAQLPLPAAKDLQELVRRFLSAWHQAPHIAHCSYGEEDGPMIRTFTEFQQRIPS